MAKIPHSKIKISLELAVLNVILFETVTQISRSTNPDVFVDNMKRNSDLQRTWSSCVIQMLNQQACKGLFFKLKMVFNLWYTNFNSYR